MKTVASIWRRKQIRPGCEKWLVISSVLSKERYDMREGIQVLSILATNKCPLQCEHCGPRSGPWEDGSIDLDTLATILEDARDAGCRVINYSGGEPFVLGKKLIEMVGMSASRRFITRITTGAYWSNSDKVASRRLVPLVEAGLNQLFISVTDSHRKFVSLDNVIRAVRSAEEMNLQVYLALGTTKTSETQTASINKAFQEAGMKSPWMLESPLIPFGRAEDHIPHEELLLRPLDQIDGPCPSMSIHPSVRSDGKILGCSVVFGDECDALCYGSVNGGRLKDAVERMQSSPLAAWIHKVGVVELKKLIEKNTDIKFAEEYVNICHLCGDILSNEEAVDFLQAIQMLDSVRTCSEENDEGRETLRDPIE